MMQTSAEAIDRKLEFEEALNQYIRRIKESARFAVVPFLVITTLFKGLVGTDHATIGAKFKAFILGTILGIVFLLIGIISPLLSSLMAISLTLHCIGQLTYIRLKQVVDNIKQRLTHKPQQPQPTSATDSLAATASMAIEFAPEASYSGFTAERSRRFFNENAEQHNPSTMHSLLGTAAPGASRFSKR
jgi:hypothetical protein